MTGESVGQLGVGLSDSCPTLGGVEVSQNDTYAHRKKEITDFQEVRESERVGLSDIVRHCPTSTAEQLVEVLRLLPTIPAQHRTQITVEVERLAEMVAALSTAPVVVSFSAVSRTYGTDARYRLAINRPTLNAEECC